jgi:hypothetical protein
MNDMKTSSVTEITDRRVRRAVAARRRLTSERRRHARRTGRVWINGSELGGTDPRHAHLALTFD